MLATVIAERIRRRGRRMRSVRSRSGDFWFPPVQVPAGFGQVRTAKQLPVLTMVTGYARWASAVLVPTRRAEDRQ
jgi:hypothetical protein